MATQSEQIRPHGTIAKMFHWSFILLFIYALTKQVDEVEELEDAALLQNEMMFASLFLGVLLARFLFMRFTRPTVLPPSTPGNLRLMATVVHLGMYFSLAMIAVTGLWIGSLYGAGSIDGNWMEVALFSHEFFVHATTILIVTHIAAAVYHRRKNDGIWSSMVPYIWKEESGEERT